MVREEQSNRYVATALTIPECTAECATQEEAIERARTAINAWLKGGMIVHVEADGPERPANPWLKSAGWLREDPEYADALDHEIAE